MQGDVLLDKENVGPRGSAAWSQQAMVAKNRGLGGGAGHDVVRKEKSGVLASNATTNNGGGAAGLGSLESLKERVKLLTLSKTSNGASWDPGSRLLKHRSPLVDIKATEGLVNGSGGGLSSKDGMGFATAHDRHPSHSQEIPSISKVSHPRPSTSEQHDTDLKSSLHSNGGHGGSKLNALKKGNVLELYEEDIAQSRDRREASRSRVEAWVNAFGHTPKTRESTSPERFATDQNVKASRSFEKHQIESRTQKSQSLSTSRDGGPWSGAKRQGTPYKLRPLLEEEKVGQMTPENEAQRNEIEVRVAAGHGSPVASRSLNISQCRDVEYSKVHGEEDKFGVRSSTERGLNPFGSQSADRVSDRRRSEYYACGLSAPAEIQSAPVLDTSRRALNEKITFSESIRLTRTSGVWSHSKDVHSTQEDSYDKECSKWHSYHTNMDATAIAPSSSFLLSVMTGASSSGSSATPGLSEGSSRDEDTVAYPESSKQTPSSKEHAIPSSRERMISRSRISKRLKPLGPASRLLLSGPALRVPIDSDGSITSKDNRSPNSSNLSPNVQSSPNKVAASITNLPSPITPEEAQKCRDVFGLVDNDLLADLKKRKAEDDPSIGEVSQVDNECSSGNKIPVERSIQSASQLSSDRLDDARRSNLLGLKASLSKEYHRPLQKGEEFGAGHPSFQRGAESTSVGDSQSSQREAGRASLLHRSADLALSSKGVLLKVHNHDAGTAASRLSGGISEKPLNGLDSLQISRSMGSREQGHLAQVKQPADAVGRFAINLPVSNLQVDPKHSPSLDARARFAETEGSRVLSGKGSAEAKEGNEAVSMSQDGLSLRDKSDTRPASVQDLSNSLGSLSLGDVQSKVQGRLPLQNLVNTSSSHPPGVPVNQATSKRQENIGVVHNTSNSSGKSVVTFESKPQNSKSLPCEKPREELSEASEESHMKEPKVECGLKPVHAERSEADDSSAQRSGEDQPKDDGEGSAAVIKRKVMEDEKFFWVNDKRYQKLGMIGKGGSSEVYKVIDSEFSIYALKKITLGGRDHSTARGFYQEIEYLERLRGKRHIVQLIDCEVTDGFVVEETCGDEKIQEDVCIYMVLEFGEIDLAGILSKRRKEMLESNEPLDDNWIRFYWKHMLSAVKTIHDERIVHADLKPANFLLVKGELKLIDFGIAKAIQTDTTHVVRDSQVGTLNYMSPEALIDNSKDEDGRVFKCGRSSDIWSLGCILYQMVYGHTPFSHIRSMYRKIQAITSSNFSIEYPPIRDPWLLDVMKRCLTWDRHLRPDIAQLLLHPFLRPDLAPHK
ncbi:serine/threonine-protein kinase TTK/MPS1 [Marchantia polymorpha subsp. ruderalis]|uniref:Protein kinase domain-containing protein n=2 Tax=Marchantia polymorpha TaxID=3197 RepID=A0A176W8B1_MARPO|nr:hypothetical protein AXG93_3102s1470 [Marchantia polymorpha subsp. ruderalis]PTQ39972.1 hypothetical protein MARPO_0042s0023 [Marchantia polymorpha]BBN02271.1 hypothetical protein Mp_2g13940 [Marchantia polymorpha subsp. ruderalis]|eukprot:PTQ39972.1 hypothetical protein MARPO_0042s0023 [Marchantia polymorpha]